MIPIPFTKEIYTENSIDCIKDHHENGISYKQKATNFIKDKWGFEHVILTTSCTHALEAMAMILNIGPEDEVLIPSYTFVSTANAFVKFGASVKCIDSKKDNPNIDEDKILEEITEKTKALVVVHYGGWACNMDKIVKICEEKEIYLLEDAAQAINSYYKTSEGIFKPLGIFGVMSAFSFHRTKNIGCGEGGMLVINDKKLIDNAEVVVEKGTNRHSFIMGKIDKYEWIDKGSSYPLAELNACFLYPQLVEIDKITEKRKEIWKYYYDNLPDNSMFKKCSHLGEKGNYHIFYLLMEKGKFNDKEFISSKHYNPLHMSKYYINNFEKQNLPEAERYGKTLLRLPLYYDMDIKDVQKICNSINKIVFS
jgi:dTDP-4-amino-4,6-dideoxygalactose transaminase